MKLAVRSPMWSSLIAVATLQSLVLGWMVWDRVSLLANGREIKSAVVPVDPRDVFRGDFVILGYGFNTGADIALPEGARQGDAVYAHLKMQGPANWTLTSVSREQPEVSGEGDVVLKATVDNVRPVSTQGSSPREALVGRLRFGIERFYVPEGTGRSLEAQVREQRVVAVLAVGSDGKAAIKALEVEGKRIAEEPLL